MSMNACINTLNFLGNGRKMKRAERKAGHADQVFIAFMLGQVDGARAHMSGKERRNPYPPGKRHNAWENGYAAGDDDGSDWNNN